MTVGTLEERLDALDDWAMSMTLHFSALEFAVEVMMANRLAIRPASEAEQFIEDLASPMRGAFIRQEGVSDAALQSASDQVSRHLEHLGRKAADRAAKLREAHPTRGSDYFL